MYEPNYTQIFPVKYLLVQISGHEGGRYYTNIEYFHHISLCRSIHICTKDMNTIKMYSAGLQGLAYYLGEINQITPPSLPSAGPDKE